MGILVHLTLITCLPMFTLRTFKIHTVLPFTQLFHATPPSGPKPNHLHTETPWVILSLNSQGHNNEKYNLGSTCVCPDPESSRRSYSSLLYGIGSLLGLYRPQLHQSIIRLLCKMLLCIFKGLLSSLFHCYYSNWLLSVAIVTGNIGKFARLLMSIFPLHWRPEKLHDFLRICWF